MVGCLVSLLVGWLSCAIVFCFFHCLVVWLVGCMVVCFVVVCFCSVVLLLFSREFCGLLLLFVFFCMLFVLLFVVCYCSFAVQNK